MQLRDALDDYKRSSGDSTLFPGERRTLSGRFSGGDGRLVHIDEGVIRDFGYPLSGLTGLERSRFGLSLGDEKFWFDDDATSTQTYYEDTGLVETVHETPIGEVTELDLTIGNAHLDPLRDGCRTRRDHRLRLAGSRWPPQPPRPAPPRGRDRGLPRDRTRFPR